MLRLVISLFFILIISNSQAKIWIVDSTPGNSARDFTTAQAAHNGAGSGDTLYFIGSGIDYGNLTFTKKLVVIGPGYFLTSNGNPQARTAEAFIGLIYFNAGSQGSVIMGMRITQSIYVNISNISIRRNYMLWTSQQLNIDDNQSNIIVAQNFITTNYTSSGNNIYIQSACSNILFSNNIILQTYSSGQNKIIFSQYTTSNVTFVNNTIRGVVEIGGIGSVFQNNIIYGTSASLIYSNFTPMNNICEKTDGLPNNNNNVRGVSVSSVLLMTGSDDGKHRMIEESEYKTAGIDGEELGAFGGQSPYVLSGIPPIPTIYFFASPVSGSSTQGLPVTIKARTNQ